MKCIDLTGNKYGKLTVISRGDDYVSPSGKRYVSWKCLCECGNTVNVRASRLKNATTRSCGCLRKDLEKNGGAFFIHGDSVKNAKYHRLFKIYIQMKQRVYHPVYKKDKQIYGNMTICDEWMNEDGYQNFKKWSLENGYENGLSIDRIDGTKGYSPDNCRWTTPKIQSNNRKNIVFLKVDDKEMNFTDWAKTLGVSPTTVATWVRKHDKKWAETHIKAILNGSEPLITKKKHKRQKSKMPNEKFLTVDGVTHNYSEWQEILDKDRYGTLISRWVNRHGEEYAIMRIKESLSGIETNRKISHVTLLKVNGEVHNLREWDAICGLHKDTVSRWCRRNSEDYAINAIKHILNDEPIERITGQHLSNTAEKKKYKYITVNETTHTISEWHEIIGLKRYSNTINIWIKNGGEEFAIKKIKERLKKINN